MKGERSSSYLHLRSDRESISSHTSCLHPNNEEMLWDSFRAGDIGAYAVIYRKYFFILYEYGKKKCHNHELVEDIIQDLFIKIWNNKENLKKTTSIRYYLLTAMRRKLLDFLRSPQARLETEYEILDIEFYAGQDTTDDVLFEKKEKVLKALNRLSTHQQKLLHLKFYRNFSNEEIAKEFNITIQSVYNAMFKALKSLRNQLLFFLIFVIS